ncbi:MAG: ChaN family lipoprotein, partial [Gammaproteobacteria bacterium]|nr:ChaN family lipoprotein [Gammaproteobacteria bacterium]NIR92438.1 ChaN family lipoprotein [Gammaproteobacteria bacterium]
MITAGYRIVPANLNRLKLRELSGKGEKGLSKSYRDMLSKASLSNMQLRSLQKEIQESHCNMLDRNTVNKLVLAQRVRDAVMAHSLSKMKSPVK